MAIKILYSNKMKDQIKSGFHIVTQILENLEHVIGKVKCLKRAAKSFYIYI